MAEQTMRRVAVLGGVRTPFARAYTDYQDVTNLDMMTTALNGLVDQYDLAGKHVDEVVGGAVVTHAKDFNLTREAVIGTKLAQTTPGVTLMQACGTSLQAALGTASKIASGEIESGIAVGADSISDSAVVFKRKFAQRLIKANKARSMGQKLAEFKRFSFGEIMPEAPNINEPRTGLSMGEHCELMAKEWDIAREAQDQLAYDSHIKGSKALNEGFLDDLITPCSGIYRDNNLREEPNLEKMGELRPAFDRSSKGTLTAANSTPLTDGASAVLLASEDWAKENNLPVLAYLTSGQHAGINFVEGAGLLMAPTIAVSKLLKRMGLELQDFDFYEIHEAFAAQVLCTLKAWEDETYCREVLDRDKPMGAIDRDKLNTRGSSLAFGHPFAATGGRILATLAKMLNEKGSGRGLISICTAGGMGVAAVLEAA